MAKLDNNLAIRVGHAYLLSMCETIIKSITTNHVTLFCSFDGATVSKMLADKWKTLNQEQKQIYYTEADHLKNLHLLILNPRELLNLGTLLDEQLQNLIERDLQVVHRNHCIARLTD